MEANETIDGLSNTEEAVRVAAEDETEAEDHKSRYSTAPTHSDDHLTKLMSNDLEQQIR